MKYNTNVKHTTLEAFVTTVNDLGIELIINEALREVRKRQLIELIDDALVNKDEAAFNQYTAEYKNLEAWLFDQHLMMTIKETVVK
ncbi:IDEAL domain protein [Staphylococcus aureus]|uniref:IDEAL domain-containing protein n=1 Tax=Staphylococcus aureus TaxID=1280 RepID=UPI000DAA9F0D|nr:IDEAL domain-containing protein [Staphylococcus aureus]PZJ27402.1 IDEAL domain protein [Staphylococcus aureus]